LQIAAPGFDPGTYGLSHIWAHRNSSLLSCCNEEGYVSSLLRIRNIIFLSPFTHLNFLKCSPVVETCAGSCCLRVSEQWPQAPGTPRPYIRNGTYW